MSQWKILKLPECLDKAPKTTNIPKKKFLASGKYPIISQEKEVVNGYWDDTGDVVSVDGSLVVFGDHTTVLKFVDFDFVVGADGVKILKPKPFLDAGYLYYYLMSKPVGGLGYARHYRLLKEIDIVFPALDKQKRIIATLDEAFEGIDTVVANTEKNLANVRELFARYVDGLFVDNTERWSTGRLSEFVDSVATGPFGSLLHKSDYVSKGVPLVNPINILKGQIVPDDRKRVDSNTARRLSAYALRLGDIVIARRGEIGRCAVVREEQVGWVCGTGCFFIRISQKQNPDFIAHLLRSNKYRKQLEWVSSGATMLNLSNTALSNLSISLPNIEQQNEVVGLISELSEECSKVEAVYQQKLTALAELKQSLLQKAFSGELTAGEAEAALEEATA